MEAASRCEDPEPVIEIGHLKFFVPLFSIAANPVTPEYIC
jgi:hypothetical protein